MARADSIVGLVQAARAHDDEAVRRAVEALAQEERNRRHHVLADRLQAALLIGAVQGANGHPERPPAGNGNGSAGRNGSNGADAARELPPPPFELGRPALALADLILSAPVERACAELVEEHGRAAALAAAELSPRHRVLLAGPSGNGKSSLAEALAGALGARLLVVRPDAAARLEEAFRLATAPQRCVLVLDGIESIAAAAPALTRLIDELPSRTVLVATTAGRDRLDPALRRRFELRLALEPPDHDQRTVFFERFLAEVDASTRYTPRRMSDATDGASFAALHDLALDIRRRAALEPERELRLLVMERLRRFAAEAPAA